jgi:hypothetical protein
MIGNWSQPTLWRFQGVAGDDSSRSCLHTKWVDDEFGACSWLPEGKFANEFKEIVAAFAGKDNGNRYKLMPEGTACNAECYNPGTHTGDINSGTFRCKGGV